MAHEQDKKLIQWAAKLMLETYHPQGGPGRSIKSIGFSKIV